MGQWLLRLWWFLGQLIGGWLWSGTKISSNYLGEAIRLRSLAY